MTERNKLHYKYITRLSPHVFGNICAILQNAIKNEEEEFRKPYQEAFDEFFNNSKIEL